MAETAVAPKGTNQAASNKVPDPQQDPVAYLKHHKWTCLGNEHSTISRCWYDPTKPRVEKWERIEVSAMTQFGEMQPVQVKNSQGHTVRAVQDRFIPKCEPVNRDDAVQIQMTRDDEALQKAEIERQAAAVKAERMAQEAAK